MNQFDVVVRGGTSFGPSDSTPGGSVRATGPTSSWSTLPGSGRAVFGRGEFEPGVGVATGTPGKGGIGAHASDSYVPED